VSLIDAPGKPFYDPHADAALFEAIEKTVITTKHRKVVRVSSNINDAAFIAAAIAAFTEIKTKTARKP
jgi:uncharacterized protein (UPF0261 family)